MSRHLLSMLRISMHLFSQLGTSLSLTILPTPSLTLCFAVAVPHFSCYALDIPSSGSYAEEIVLPIQTRPVLPAMLRVSLPMKSVSLMALIRIRDLSLVQVCLLTIFCTLRPAYPSWLEKKGAELHPAHHMPHLSLPPLSHYAMLAPLFKFQSFGASQSNFCCSCHLLSCVPEYCL